MPSAKQNDNSPSDNDTGKPCAMMSLTEWLRYFSDGPKSPRTKPPSNARHSPSRFSKPTPTNRRYCCHNGSSRWYLALRLRSMSGEAGARSLSNGPPGATRTRQNARKLITSTNGTNIATRLRK